MGLRETTISKNIGENSTTKIYHRERKGLPEMVNGEVVASQKTTVSG